MIKGLKALVLALLLPTTLASAQVVVNVSGAQRVAKPIAIVPIVGDPGVQMEFIIASDLHKTGLFQPLAPEKFNMRPTSPNEINYPDWQQVGADYLVLGRMLNSNESGQFVLSEVSSASIVANEKVDGRDARHVAHNAADMILEKLTGKRGSFATQLAYVLEQEQGGVRRYSLLVSDVDGANRREIFSHSNPILSPAWSPDGSQLAFVTFNDNHSQIIIQNIASGSRRVVAQGDGISGAPAFSPDGRSLAYVQSSESNPDIYLMNLASGAATRITQHPGIDTEPVFSPDGRSIYFTSDRAGSPQIYRRNLSGGAERAVIGSGYQANGDLSPDGTAMVLTRQTGGGHQIGLYDLNSGRFETLTSGSLDEGASFAPNGQMIIYATRENGRSVLKMINRFGEVAQTLSDPAGRLRDPAWGPDTRR